MDLFIGTTVAQYQIVELIGKGGMASVYKAYDQSLGRYVALKIPLPQFAGDPNFVARFVREAQIAAGLQNAHIIRIYQVHRDAPVYIAMEFIEGETLAARLNRVGRLDLKSAGSILTQIADALEYAHTRGIVHRDVKPSNILIDRAGSAYLTDFGIAKAAESTRLTVTGTALGTPEYMSPEQCQGKQATSHSDIYSLGIVVFEMLTGQAPFHADTPIAMLYQQIHTPPPALRQLNVQIPLAVEQVILRALAKSPLQRYASAIAFARDFVAASAGARVGTTPSPTNPMLIAGIALIAGLFLIGCLVVLALAIKPPSPTPTPLIAAVRTNTSAPTLVRIASETPTLLPRATDTPTRFVSDTPTAAITRRPTNTPTPTSTIALPRVVFEEDFSSLNASIWNVENLAAGNAATVSGGTLRLSSSGSRIPYVYTRSNPFPITGDFRVTLYYRYPQFSACGATIMLTSGFLPVHNQGESPSINEVGNKLSFFIWHELFWYDTNTGRQSIQLSSDYIASHELVIEYRANRYRVTQDNVNVFTSGVIQARPRYLGFGNPAVQANNCSWDTLEIQSVVIETLP